MRGRLGWVLVSLSLGAACGGRYDRGEEEPSGTGGSTVGRAGTPSAAGSPGRGGRPSGGTASTGGSPVGGTASTGAVTSTSGTSGGGGCFCAAPSACPPGYRETPSPSGCCTECVFVSNCEEQRLEYLAYREALIQKLAPYKCSKSADCITYYDKNQCQATSCGFIVDTTWRMTLDTELDAFARQACDAECPPWPVPPCAEPSPPVCVEGYCK